LRRIEWLAAARTSWLGLVFDEIDQRVGAPEFSDALVRVEMPVGDQSRVIAGWMLLDDELNFCARRHRNRAGALSNATGWVRGEFAGERWNLNTAVAPAAHHAARFVARADAQGSVDDVRRHDATTGRLEFVRRGPRSQSVAGLEVAHYVSEYDYRGDAAFEPRFAAAFGRPQNVAFARSLDVGGDDYAAYLLHAWEATGATFSAGLRWDTKPTMASATRRFRRVWRSTTTRARSGACARRSGACTRQSGRTSCRSRTARTSSMRRNAPTKRS
jgi:hypothetical protein